MHEKEIKGWLPTVALYQRRPLKKINRLVEKPLFRIFGEVKPRVERTFLLPFGFKLNVIDLLFQRFVLWEDRKDCLLTFLKNK